MPKHQDALPSFADFKAPWESETGENEIEKPTLKKYIFNLLTDKAKAQDARDESVELVKTAEAERDEAKKQAADASGEETAKALKKAEAERDQYKAENDSLKAAKAEADLRAEVLAGVDPKVAKYVTGATKEELEKSLEAVKADFGIVDGDGEEEEVNPLASRPRTNLTNPLNEGPKKGDEPVDFDKVAGQIIGSRLL